MRSAMYINGRVKILPLNCRNRGLSRMTRIVEFVYQGVIDKGCFLLNRLLIAYLLCKNAYPTYASLMSKPIISAIRVIRYSDK